MLNTIAVMNTKGGVGKSTLVLALAETISAYHGKNVLVIDSDAQASVSSMLMSIPDLYKLQTEGRTIVDYLVSTVLNGTPTDWTQFIVSKVSDVDDARGVYVLPSDMQLTLLEREVSKESQHTRLRAVIGRLLADAGNVFDVVLIDCPPGLSVLTECWLREADFHISPTKPDYVSICGLEVLRRFKALNPEMGFARNLGIIVNLEDTSSPTDAEYRGWLAGNADNRCFAQSVPRVRALQDAARHQTLDRSYAAKYPGTVGQAMRALTAEVMERLQVDQTAAALANAAEEARRAAEEKAAAAARLAAKPAAPVAPPPVVAAAAIAPAAEPIVAPTASAPTAPPTSAAAPATATSAKAPEPAAVTPVVALPPTSTPVAPPPASKPVELAATTAPAAAPSAPAAPAPAPAATTADVTVNSPTAAPVVAPPPLPASPLVESAVAATPVTPAASPAPTPPPAKAAEPAQATTSTPTTAPVVAPPPLPASSPAQSTAAAAPDKPADTAPPTAAVRATAADAAAPESPISAAMAAAMAPMTVAMSMAAAAMAPLAAAPDAPRSTQPVSPPPLPPIAPAATPAASAPAPAPSAAKPSTAS